MFSEGLARVEIDNKSGFIDIEGNEIVSLNWDYAQNFADGCAVIGVNPAQSEAKYRKLGYIDKTGRVVADTIYEEAEDFVDGVGIVNLHFYLQDFAGNFGAINKEGKEVIRTIYSGYMAPYSQGRVCLQRDYFWGYVNEFGDEITEFKYCFAEPFSEGYAAVLDVSNNWFLINRDGQEAHQLDFGRVYGLTSGLVKVANKSKEGFADLQGNVVVELKYDEVYDFSEGLAVVKQGDKFGFVDIEGREVIPLKYGGANSFDEGLAMVFLDGKRFFIDRFDNLVLPINYEWPTPCFGPEFENGIAQIATVTEMGIIKGYIGMDGTEYFED